MIHPDTRAELVRERIAVVTRAAERAKENLAPPSDTSATALAAANRGAGGPIGTRPVNARSRANLKGGET